MTVFGLFLLDASARKSSTAFLSGIRLALVVFSNSVTVSPFALAAKADCR